MLQHKIAAQVLILSIFNLVIAAPVVPGIYETHDDEVVPVVVRNVEVMSEVRRGSDLEGPTASDSSTPLPDGLAPSHSSPPLPDGSTPSSTSADEPAILNERPTSPATGGPTSGSLTVSSPPGETAPATDEPVSIHSTSTPQDNTAATNDVLNTEPPSLDAQHEARMKRLKILTKAGIVVGTILAIGDWLWTFNNLNRRTIEPDDHLGPPRSKVTAVANLREKSPIVV